MVSQRLFKILIGLTSLVVASSSQAFSLDWSGTYRVEYFSLDDPQLNDSGSKSYFLNHLELSPTVIATDNIKITSQFQVLPNATYSNSQLGQFMGSSLGTSDSDVLSQNQGATQILTTQLYMTWEQEYGSLIVGRAPIDFGLGMTYNGGFDAFDHWHDIKDVFGYKFVLGNFYIMPMLAKVVDQGPGQGATVNDQMIELQYENPESGSLFAIFYEGRSADQGVNDAFPRTPSSASVTGDFSSTRVNIAIGRDFNYLNMMVEGGFYTGDTGVSTSDNKKISIDAFGIASEIRYHQEGSKFTSGLDLGYASGDDPATTDTFEGYLFDRNYNVALLMMNHPLGAGVDYLGTNIDKGSVDSRRTVDTESVSNVVYVSPYVNWAWDENLDITNRFTYGQLQSDPDPANSVSKSLGFEWDIGVSYRPQERVEWITEVGLLFPGEAFKDGSANLENKFTYGIGTKAAISF